MTRGPVVIGDSNLSRAWAGALLALRARGTACIAPLVVTITDLEHGIVEDPVIREAVDAALREAGMKSARTTASTMFPSSMHRAGAPRAALYDRYAAVYSRIRRADPANHYGTYFQRMIAYQPSGVAQPINQLEHVISTYAANNHRRSALQLAIFDPTRDHTNQRQRGFPCLHQVAFSPVEGGRLVVTGFYGTQHIFLRGYGNYLGLCNLGEFVAGGLGLQLTRVTCVAGVAELGTTKDAVANLAAAVGAAPAPAVCMGMEQTDEH